MQFPQKIKKLEEKTPDQSHEAYVKVQWKTIYTNRSLKYGFHLNYNSDISLKSYIIAYTTSDSFFYCMRHGY